jgi:hypothetical protein
MPIAKQYEHLVSALIAAYSPLFEDRPRPFGRSSAFPEATEPITSLVARFYIGGDQVPTLEKIEEVLEGVTFFYKQLDPRGEDKRFAASMVAINRAAEEAYRVLPRAPIED